MPPPPLADLPPIILPTAQLGLDYGIANRSGRPDPDQARALLAAAREGGLDWLDTAPEYGQAEARRIVAGVDTGTLNRALWAAGGRPARAG